MIIIQWPSVIRTDFPSGMEFSFLIGKGLPTFYGKFKLFRGGSLHCMTTFTRGSRCTLLGVNTFPSLPWSWGRDKGSFIRFSRAGRICLDNTYIQTFFFFFFLSKLFAVLEGTKLGHQTDLSLSFTSYNLYNL